MASGGERRRGGGGDAAARPREGGMMGAEGERRGASACGVLGVRIVVWIVGYALTIVVPPHDCR